MIRYALRCTDGHDFESWFQNAAAFDSLSAAGHVTCPACGTTEVAKSLMAPRVATSEAKPPAEPPAVQQPEAPGAPETKAPDLAALKARIEAECDYVGDTFVSEARAMHDGEAPQRGIYGEASAKDAIGLLEDGIPVAPLPFLPTRKAN